MGKYKGKYAMVAGCHCLRVARLICILVYFRLTVTVKQLINLSYGLNYLYTHTFVYIYALTNITTDYTAVHLLQVFQKEKYGLWRR